VDRWQECGAHELGKRRGGCCVGCARLGRIQAAVAERDVLFDDEVDDEVGHAHARQGAAGLVESGIDALHGLASRRSDDRSCFVGREVLGPWTPTR